MTHKLIHRDKTRYRVLSRLLYADSVVFVFSKGLQTTAVDERA